MAKKLLKRNKKEKIISGVLSGIAAYYNLDVTVVRIIFLALLSVSGFIPLTVAYFVAALVIPE